MDKENKTFSRNRLKEFLSKEVQLKVIEKYDCPDCGEKDVKKVEFVIHAGPRKGEKEIGVLGCKCADKKLAKERTVDLNKKQAAKNLMNKFAKYSLINESLESASFENYETTNEVQAQAKSVAVKYAKDFPNVGNLLFRGNYGTGKSHLSVSITKELINKGHNCIFISYPKLLTKIKDSFNSDSVSEDEIIRLMKQVDLLVIDDLGAEHKTPWTTSRLFEIVDDRAGKPTVFTTNLDPYELKDWVGDRIFSRIMNNTQKVHLDSFDYRRLSD